VLGDTGQPIGCLPPLKGPFDGRLGFSVPRW